MKSILFDLDGVFYQGNQIIDNSPDVYRWVQKQSIPHLFVTNTSSISRLDMVAKLLSFGMKIKIEKIFTPIVATMSYLKSKSIDKNVALYMPDSTKADFGGFGIWNNDVQKPEAIVIGDLGFKWNYQLLNTIFRQLMDKPDIPLISLGMTRYWQAEDGLRLDIAPFIKALECASGKTAIVMGKPSKAFFSSALKVLGKTSEETIMIGDDIKGDIEGAQKVGMQGWLVKTGKYRDSDLKLGVKPDKIIHSVIELNEHWVY